MLGQSYISKEEKVMAACKAAKARLTLLFGGGASGDNEAEASRSLSFREPKSP